MKPIYYIIRSLEAETITSGIHFATHLQLAGHQLKDLFLHEITLLQTGWAENSYKMLVAAEEKEDAQLFTDYLVQSLEEELCKRFEVAEFGDISFDDEDLSKELETAIQIVVGKFPQAIQV